MHPILSARSAPSIAGSGSQGLRPFFPGAGNADLVEGVGSGGKPLAGAATSQATPWAPYPSLETVGESSCRLPRRRPVLSTPETHDGEKDVQGSPTPSELSTSSDLLDEHWFGGMNAGSYYASLAQGMLMEPPAARARSEDGGEYSGVQTPLWNTYPTN
ncbi:hypothetical protein TRIUR3_21818 [Triticum urartu]|uniref:Uncharacterized protein n=1 Tax=Triticum urartu TaxID=4572 RepID=M8A9A2_TRIUA|nr:hypothetical protein TRIUR3_21818 [Triticum urartu]